MEVRPIALDDAHVARLAEFFRAAFPDARHYTVQYLEWLYRENPAGAVVGFDAIEADRVAAHYACVPAEVWWNGRLCRALLSLNTATHPDFQGKGLFTKLANATFERAASEGYSFVYGVANANSTPGFTRKLGFQLVAPLDVHLKFGGVPSAAASNEPPLATFYLAWTTERMAWRLRNPASRYWLMRSKDGTPWIAARTNHPGIACCAPTVIDAESLANPALHSGPLSPIKLFLGFDRRASGRGGFPVVVPDKLRPSPLNLIFRNLKSAEPLTQPVRFSFLDFDPY